MENIKRINISIDECLLNRIDSYSKKRFLSRSGLISMVLSSYLDNVDLLAWQKCKRSQGASEEDRFLSGPWSDTASRNP